MWEIVTHLNSEFLTILWSINSQLLFDLCRINRPFYSTFNKYENTVFPISKHFVHIGLLYFVPLLVLEAVK